MLKNLLPPLCLLLAICLAVTGFSMLAFGAPEASIALHDARASGDELAKEAFEADLTQRQTSRVVMIGALFLGSAVMTVVAFSTMQGASHKRK